MAAAAKAASTAQKLAAKLPALVTGVVSQASGTANRVAKEVTGVYRSKPVQTFIKDASVELTPPPIGQIPSILTKGFQGMGAEVSKIGGLTVKEAGIKAITVFEVSCWFLLGEIVGRRSFFGYKFPLE